MASFALALCAAVAMVTQHASAITLKNGLPANPRIKTFAALPDPGQLSEVIGFEKRRVIPPIMMATHGCSCTTAGIHVLAEILRAHSIEPADLNYELMRTLEESTDEVMLKDRLGYFGRTPPYLQNTGSLLSSRALVDKLKIVYGWTQNESTALIFKGEFVFLENPKNAEAMDFLKQINANVFRYTRSNFIDMLACSVKDFCNVEYIGTRVDANGQDLGCGFRGRGADEDLDTKMYVKFNTTALYWTIHHEYKIQESFQSFLEAHGYSGNIYSAEDLLAFEYGDEAAFNKSVGLWAGLLGSFGINPDHEAITSALHNIGTFPPPKKSSESIYNFEEVRQALKGSKYYGMLRQ